MTLDDIKGRVAHYLDRDDIAPLVEDWVNQTQRRIQRAYNWRCMESRQTLSSSTAYLSIPTGYKEAIWLDVLRSTGDYKRLEKTFANDALRRYPFMDSETGEPELWCLSHGISSIIVRPTPDQEYSFDIFFFKYLDDLSSSNTTNWFTDNLPELLVYGSLVEASGFIVNKDMFDIWNQLYNGVLATAISNEKAEKIDGGSINIKTII